jgi:hypothetical protein
VIELPPFDQYGLREGHILDALRFSEDQRKHITRYHPVTAEGTRVSDARAARFREAVMELGTGWTMTDRENIAGVITPCGRYKIVTMAGDSATGIRDRNPHSRYDKGPAILRAIMRNNAPQRQLFSTDEQETSKEPELHIFLVRRTEHGRTAVVRWEVSFPNEVNNHGQICGWGTRLIGEPLELKLKREPDPKRRKPSVERPNVDVAVSRRPK